MPNGYTSECLGLYWSNPPFFKFLTFGRCGTQDRALESPNVKKSLKWWLRSVWR